MSDFNRTTRVGVQRESQDVDKTRRSRRMLNIERGILNYEVKKAAASDAFKMQGGTFKRSLWVQAAERIVFLLRNSTFPVRYSIFNLLINVPGLIPKSKNN